MTASTYSFPSNLRLQTSTDFDQVFKKPIKLASRQITIFASANQLERPRLGLIIGKRQIKKAVARNQFKRLIRENFRLNQHNFAAWDIIVIVYKSAEQLEKHEFSQQLNKQWRRLWR